MSALSDLAAIEAEGPAPIAHTHYSLCVAAAIRRALADSVQVQPIVTVGDGRYQLMVTVAGRDHIVTVCAVPVRARVLS